MPHWHGTTHLAQYQNSSQTTHLARRWPCFSAPWQRLQDQLPGLYSWQAWQLLQFLQYGPVSWQYRQHRSLLSSFSFLQPTHERPFICKKVKFGAQGCFQMSILDALLGPLTADWDELDVLSIDAINAFVDRWETAFVTFGCFVKGLRVRTVYIHELHDCRHCTISGMLGILALNMAVLKTKQNIA